MGIKQIVGKRVQAGLRLGKFLQGMSKAVPVVMKKDHYRLGYKPDGKEMKKQMKNHKEKKMASLKGTTVEGEPMVFFHLRETFYSVGIEHDDIQPKPIAMMEDFEKLKINTIEGNEVKREHVRVMVCPQASGSAPMLLRSLLFSLFHNN